MSLLDDLNEMIADVDQIEWWFDADGNVVAGWKQGDEILAHFGSNTELARTLAALFVDAINGELAAAYHGYCAALEDYAVWRDGTQIVGCGVYTLQQALDEAKARFNVGVSHAKRSRPLQESAEEEAE